uniref:Uncharacterized protein n=1 Tax=Ciona savignyi TaxID=51511 RepID=H2YEX0_CIOSA
MFKQIGIANSFTLEATFAGTTCGNKVGRHFNISDFQLVGRSLCESILEYSNTFDNPVKKSKTILQMTTEVMRKQRLSKPVKTSNEINPTLSPRDHHPSNKVQTSHTTPNAQAAKTLPQQYPESATSSNNDGNMQTNIQSKRETNIPSINQPNKTEISDINEDINNTVGTEPQCHRKPNVYTALSEHARTTNEVHIENGAIDEDAALPEYDGYLEMIKNFKLSDLSSESETSFDSDSESEPEVPYESPA